MPARTGAGRLSRLRARLHTAPKPCRWCVARDAGAWLGFEHGPHQERMP